MSSMLRLELGAFSWGPSAARIEDPHFNYEMPQYDYRELAKCREGSVALTARWLAWELNFVSDWPANLMPLRET